MAQCPQAPLLRTEVASHRDLLQASRTTVNPQRSLKDYKVAGPHHYPAPQEAGVHEHCSLLAPSFLGKAANMVRGPFLQGAVNGYYL